MTTSANHINSRQQSAISGLNGQAHINERSTMCCRATCVRSCRDDRGQILTNRKQMAVGVVENARPDLAIDGLEVVTFNVPRTSRTPWTP